MDNSNRQPPVSTDSSEEEDINHSPPLLSASSVNGFDENQQQEHDTANTSDQHTATKSQDSEDKTSQGNEDLSSVIKSCTSCGALEDGAGLKKFCTLPNENECWNVSEEPEEAADSDAGGIAPLRAMFPDLTIHDDNLKLPKLQQMSTTDVTRQIVNLEKQAEFTLLKPAARLIPKEKTWLSALTEDMRGEQEHSEAQSMKTVYSEQQSASRNGEDTDDEDPDEVVVRIFEPTGDNESLSSDESENEEMASHL